MTFHAIRARRVALLGAFAGGTPAQFKAYIATEVPKWKEIVQASGATIGK
jgi:hypothetical protein